MTGFAVGLAVGLPLGGLAVFAWGWLPAASDADDVLDAWNDGEEGPDVIRLADYGIGSDRRPDDTTTKGGICPRK